MSDGDWDLYAVVRSCTTSTSVDNHHMEGEQDEKEQPCSDQFSFQNNNYADPISYTLQTTALDYGLQEINQPFSNINADYENEQVINNPQHQEPKSGSFSLPITSPSSSTLRSRRRCFFIHDFWHLKNTTIVIIYSSQQHWRRMLCLWLLILSFFSQEKPASEDGISDDTRRIIWWYLGMAEIWSKTYQRLTLSQVPFNYSYWF